MKEAFRFLESMVNEDDPLLSTVDISDAQWACKIAVREALEYILTLTPEEQTAHMQHLVSTIKSKKTPLKQPLQ